MFNPVAGFDEPMAEYFIPKNIFPFFFFLATASKGEKTNTPNTDKKSKKIYLFFIIICLMHYSNQWQSILFPKTRIVCVMVISCAYVIY